MHRPRQYTFVASGKNNFNKFVYSIRKHEVIIIVRLLARPLQYLVSSLKRSSSKLSSVFNSNYTSALLDGAFSFSLQSNSSIVVMLYSRDNTKHDLTINGILVFKVKLFTNGIDHVILILISISQSP